MGSYIKLLKRLFAIVLVFCLGNLNGLASPHNHPPGQYLQIGESRIYYEEAGKGEAVLLVHDGLASSVTWDSEWQALAKKFHVIRYDRRGYGLSDAPTKKFAQWDDF